jgi:hypothetical protein
LVNGFTDPSFFPFFTVFAFAMVLSLLRIFCFLSDYTVTSAIRAPNSRRVFPIARTSFKSTYRQS